MAVDIGPKIGIEGEAQFRREIQQTNAALKTMAAEGKAVASAFDSEADAEKKAAAQKDVLNRQIEAQKKKLELLEKGLHDATEMYGSADERTQKWAQAVYEATAKLNGMEHDLRNVSGSVEDTADSMEDAEEASQGWADVMKGQLLADAIKTGLSKMADLVKSAASAMWEASKAGAAYADDILTMATTTGMSTKNLQQYKYMADLIDVSLDTLTGSMTKLTSTMSKANKGNATAVKTFEDLGVAITDSNGQLRSTEDVFNDVVDALGRIENETERDAKAMDIFGKSAKELNPLIEAGADRLRDLAEQADETGYVLTGASLEALGKQQDAMDKFDKTVEGLSNRFAVGLAPSIETAYNKLDEIAASPKVRQAMDDVSEAIGSVIEGAVGLAEKALPYILDFFGIFDDKLRIYTDDQLALIQKTEDLRAAHQDLVDEFNGKAKAIVDETGRVKDLWNELQELVGKHGEVKEADMDRVNFIKGELNDALGIQLEMEGHILKGYRDQIGAIDELIQKREAEALLAAGQSAFAENKARQEEYLRNAADYRAKIAEAEQAYADAVRAHNEAAGKLFANSKKTKQELDDTKAALDGLKAEYAAAQAEYRDVYAETERYSRAQAAAAKGNYTEVIRLLADELGFTMDYYLQKHELNEQDKADLAAKIEDAKAMIAEYKQALQDGATGFSEAGLQEWEDYANDLQAILDGRLGDVRYTGQRTGEQYLDGFIAGLEEKLRLEKLQRAAANAASSIDKAARRQLQISSPSKAAAWIGEMWDAGLIKGLEDSEAELAKAGASLADTIITSSTPGTDLAYDYGNGLTASGAGYGTTSNAYTTNMGGITVRIDGAGAVNADELAQRVAVRLTDELRRAQRGGRA